MGHQAEVLVRLRFPDAWPKKTASLFEMPIIRELRTFLSDRRLVEVKLYFLGVGFHFPERLALETLAFLLTTLR